MQPYGLVDSKFYTLFKRELTQLWHLIDVHQEEHFVMFETKPYDQRLIVGWDELRHHYKMKENHSLSIRYIGTHEDNSTFNITIIKEEQKEDDIQQPTRPPCNEAIIPHIKSTILDKVQWKVKLTKYKE